MSLIDNIQNAGIIGAGGAGFPTHVKLKTDAEYILLNGAECEPLLRVDQQLMAKYPKEIIRGFDSARQLVNAPEGIIGIKGKHRDVISILENAIKELCLSENIKVGILPDIYPAGDEQVLVYELTGRIVPEASIPGAVGCVVINAETALNIYRAVFENQPVIRKYITVAGDVPNPVTVCVPVGTPVMTVLAMSGRTDFTGYRVIDGGPMMGHLLADMDGFITKKTKGFVVLPEEHYLIRKKERGIKSAIRLNKSACEQCSLCTDLCPRHLLGHSTAPHKMVRALAYGSEADESKMIALTCCQCNLCEYFSCPAGISPKMANVKYINDLRQQGIKFTAAKDSYQVNAMRDYRLIPSKRLIARLNLGTFDKPAPMKECDRYQSDTVGIMLNSHVGAPAASIVAKGDTVLEGQLIAKPEEGKLGAYVHASIGGVIEEITDKIIIIRRN